MKKVLVFVCACVFATVVNAQTHFSGEWKFTDQESISGKLYSNGSPKSLKITQSASQVIIEQTTAGANGDVTTSSTLPSDGKVFETKTTSGRRKTVTLTWNGTTGFTTVTSTFDTTDPAKMVFKTTDIFTMDDKGLALQRKAENFGNGEVWESKAYYER